ncbi:limbic system-associated membrane protein-like [Xenia sp. Carnegie-2017]|uniref:limbic system-associated membrane protein-like n=1 Tax=Xenia sp. Carnegie-2017 TaxID=2897299 RepID=UPI001F03EBA1|nr:limbic system-associated membrane protein-like [Xenia sp. Carnegie-2017]
MEKFGFFSFVLFCWISSCQGKILSPPPGTSFTFLPGETHNIIWTFDDDLNALDSRDWFFTGSNVSIGIRLATVARDFSLIKLNAPILPNYDVYKPSRLELRNITHSYDGTYNFRLVRRDSLLSPFISEVRVFVAIKPNATINCSTTLVVNEGDNVSCVCRGEGGNPPANVTWFDKDNNILGDVGVVSKTLVITNVTMNDDGNYRCKAQTYNDPRFRDEKSIEVIVKDPPQQTNITISPMSVKKGQNVTITCESDGYPEPTYTIYHNGAVISNNKTYIIQSVNFNHAGSYRCKAKNKLGNDLSDVKNLTIIKVKPNVEINCSTPLVVDEGDNVSCVCRGEGGIPPANVTWFDKDNNIIGDVGVVSKTLVITNVTLNDGGTYRCKAQSYNDPRFTDEKSIEVTVKATYNVLCDGQKENKTMQNRMVHYFNNFNIWNYRWKFCLYFIFFALSSTLV